MSKQAKIVDSDEAWDDGTLGRDARHAKRVIVPKEQAAELDEGLGLQMVAMRLPKKLIEDLKVLGRHNGLGYQPLVRNVLTRFVRAEYKRIASERINELAAPGEEQGRKAA